MYVTVIAGLPVQIEAVESKHNGIVTILSWLSPQ